VNKVAVQNVEKHLPVIIAENAKEAKYCSVIGSISNIFENLTRHRMKKFFLKMKLKMIAFLSLMEH
jgi:hypothetical protein